jgi:hypothetical protein
MTRLALLVFSAGVWLAGPGEARAHFLFVRIGPPAEAGRMAEVYFSEQAEAGDPRFILKIAHTRLWLQAAPGSFRPLKVYKATDRLRAPVPVSGSLAVIGVCEYGVLARPKKVPFLLRHFPKAMAGTPEALNQLQPSDKVPLEIMASVQDDGVQLTVLRAGKPLPRAQLNIIDSQLKGAKLTTDADGRVTWKPPHPGGWSIYTSSVTKTSGTFRDRKYEEVRDFATLAFRWPLAPKGADPAAVALFEEALATRAHWQGMPGFSARIQGSIDGRAFAGKVSVSGKGELDLVIDDDAVRSWVEDHLSSVVLHRTGGARGERKERGLRVYPSRGPSDPGGQRDEPKAKAKPVLRFSDEEVDHPLGRLVLFEGGRFASSYRIKDKQIRVVNRDLGGRHMTITVLDTERNADGRFLPHSYTVQYWDAETGALQRAETVRQSWQRFGNWDLPTSYTTTAATEAGLSVRSFTLSGHKLLRAK